MFIMIHDDERDSRRDQVREFVKDEIVKELTDMTHTEVIKDAINNLYGIKMTDDEIKYCEADVRFVLDVYKKKKEEEQKMKEIKLFFNSWCPQSNEVLFILFKDGTRNYYDLRHHNIKAHTVCLYIEDVEGRYVKIAFAAIEDWAVGVRNPGESALSAIPDWFEERINNYCKKDVIWNLYYAKDSTGKDTVLIAQNFDDAVVFCKEANFSVPIYIGDADSRDKYFKEDSDDCSILTVTECTDGMPCLATKKYVAEIDRVKEEIKMIHLITGYNNEEKENNAIKNNIWNLYYTRTDSAQQDRVIIAKTLEEATEYAKNRYMGCTEPVWFAEADEHDKNVRANDNTPSTLWTTHEGDKPIVGNHILTAVEKYADKIEQVKRELGIPATGSIEVRYHKSYTRKFENVVKYEEDIWFGVKTLFITDSAGRRIEIPMASIKEYVVDMPNDKKTVKEKITLDKEEIESIIAEMRALEEKLKKIKEEG